MKHYPPTDVHQRAQVAARRIAVECHTGDREADHGNADGILIEFLGSAGLKELVAEWERVEKWYA